jgi:undecaprenyl-diphosphatase
MAYFWWLWFKDGKDAASRQNMIVVSFAGALSAVAISRILQRLLPFHDRLVHAAGTGFVLPTGVDPKSLSDWSSLPSDHAALFFALSTAIWFQSRRLGFLAGLWTTFVICVPRIYLGFHYPSDVLAGAVLGVAIMVGTYFWAGSARWPARIVDWSRAHQTAFYALAFLATYEITVLFYDLRALAEDGFHILRSVTVASA